MLKNRLTLTIFRRFLEGNLILGRPNMVKVKLGRPDVVKVQISLQKPSKYGQSKPIFEHFLASPFSLVGGPVILIVVKFSLEDLNFFSFFRPQCQRTPLQPHRHTKRARRSWSRAARRWQRLKKAKRGGVGYWIKLLQNKYPQLFDNLQKSKLMNHDILNDGMDADCQSKNSFFF